MQPPYTPYYSESCSHSQETNPRRKLHTFRRQNTTVLYSWPKLQLSAHILQTQTNSTASVIQPLRYRQKHHNIHATKVEAGTRDPDTPPPQYLDIRPPQQQPPRYHHAMPYRYFITTIVLECNTQMSIHLPPAKPYLCCYFPYQFLLSGPLLYLIPNPPINIKITKTTQSHTPPNTPSHTHQDELKSFIPRQTPCPGPFPTPCYHFPRTHACTRPPQPTPRLPPPRNSSRK